MVATVSQKKDSRHFICNLIKRYPLFIILLSTWSVACGSDNQSWFIFFFISPNHCICTSWENGETEEIACLSFRRNVVFYTYVVFYTSKSSPVHSWTITHLQCDRMHHTAMVWFTEGGGQWEESPESAVGTLMHIFPTFSKSATQSSPKHAI